MADGKYFEKWQDVIEHFKKDLEGIELNQEQQDIYDVVLQQKDKIRLRINDLNELEDIFVSFGTRKKRCQKAHICALCRSSQSCNCVGSAEYRRCDQARKTYRGRNERTSYIEKIRIKSAGWCNVKSHH